jgi:hypothetical protein
VITESWRLIRSHEELEAGLQSKPNEYHCPAYRGAFVCCPYGHSQLINSLMRFKVPSQGLTVRLFERVKTNDDQYDVFDIGIEQPDGSIDSLVVGGSFVSAKRFVQTYQAEAISFSPELN